MDNEQLKEVLVEFQTQINDLLKLQLELNMSFNSQSKQLNDDFHNVYQEIYNKKPSQEAEEFLKLVEFKTTEFSEITDKRTEKLNQAFDERFEFVHKNLEKINKLT